MKAIPWGTEALTKMAASQTTPTPDEGERDSGWEGLRKRRRNKPGSQPNEHKVPNVRDAMLLEEGNLSETKERESNGKLRDIDTLKHQLVATRLDAAVTLFGCRGRGRTRG